MKALDEINNETNNEINSRTNKQSYKLINFFIVLGFLCYLILAICVWTGVTEASVSGEALSKLHIGVLIIVIGKGAKSLWKATDQADFYRTEYLNELIKNMKLEGEIYEQKTEQEN